MMGLMTVMGHAASRLVAEGADLLQVACMLVYTWGKAICENKTHVTRPRARQPSMCWTPHTPADVTVVLATHTPTSCLLPFASGAQMRQCYCK